MFIPCSSHVHQQGLSYSTHKHDVHNSADPYCRRAPHWELERPGLRIALLVMLFCCLQPAADHVANDARHRESLEQVQ